MPARKDRIPVVLDTNVIIANYLGNDTNSPVKRVFNLWRKYRSLQLIVSDGVIQEYLTVLERLNVSAKAIAIFAERIEKRRTVSRTSLGKRPTGGRDPKDNVFLATAMAGRAEYLITLDKDLLEISESDRRKFKFQIVTPAAFVIATGS